MANQTLSTQIRPDDMLVVSFGACACAGYVMVDADESTGTVVLCREGSVPHQTGMSLVAFAAIVNGNKGETGPCPA